MTVWDRVDPEFRRRVAAIEDLPHGTAQVRQSEDALRAAQRTGRFAEELAARLNLSQALYYVPSDPSELTHYTWLRAALERPADVDEADIRNIMWRLKWALSRMLQMPEVELTTIEEAVEDFGRLLDRYGFRARPLHDALAHLAQERQDGAEVRRRITLMRAESRDEMSDCEACEPSGMASWLAPFDPAAALEVLEPVVDGGLSCEEEPERSLALHALLSLETGDADTAVRMHRRGWRPSRDRPELATAVARHLVVLVRLGNTDRALDALLPRLAWHDELPLPEERMRFVAAAALTLRSAIAAGIAPEQVDGRPVAQVADELAAEAARIAAAFDRRNGNEGTTRSIAAWLDLDQVPVTPTLPPLRIHDRTGASSSDASSTDRHPVAADESRSGLRGSRQTRPARPTGIVEHWAVLERQMDELDPGITGSLDAWLAHRGDLLTEVTDEGWLAVSRLDRAASGTAGANADELLTSAREAAVRAGDEVQVTRVDIAALLQRAGSEEGEVRERTIGEARDLADGLAEAGERREAGYAWASIAGSDVASDPASDYARAVDLLTDQDVPLMLGRLLMTRAAQLVATDPRAATADLDRAEELPGVRDHWLLGRETSFQRGRLAWSEGDTDTARKLIESSVDEDAGDDVRPTVHRRLVLADVLIDAQDFTALSAQARVLLTAADELGEAHLLALAQRLAGIAALRTGEPLTAAELFEAALPELEPRDHPQLVGSTADQLGHALRQLGDHGGARSAYATAATAYEAAGLLEASGELQFRAGDAAWDAGDLDAAEAHHARARDLGRELGDLGLFLSATRDHAGVVATAGDVQAGLEELDGAEEATIALAKEHGHDDIDLTAQRSGILLQGANFLATGDDPGAAVVRARSAIDAAVDDEDRLLATANLVRFLADDDQVDRAVATMTDIWPQLSAHRLQGARSQTLPALCNALARAGRDDEADTWWERGESAGD
ncbi:hypothetical protein [Luteipulveratus flavus]|uniref:Tetratricopeptide repeat protein n=1 Tax=Luteipulveratus flavus TaxID=3031728 RepID=A0ABT6C4Q1_9MICO|nr:hypothetical protein [Luteipulveratus sp. YIM 133296]MDF8263676.1 hypothetical protein [Luteipulveratus sp. YIM 133296]